MLAHFQRLREAWRPVALPHDAEQPFSLRDAVSRVTTAVFLALVLAATLAWAATIATTPSLHQSDTAGNGLSFSFATLGVIITWGLLAVVLVIGLSHVPRPTWLPFIAILGYAGSGAAAITVIRLLKDDSHFSAQWPIVTLILAPILMLGFAVWAAFPSLQHHAEPQMMFGGVWTVILLLSVLPFPLRTAPTKRLLQQRAAYLTAQDTRDADGRANWRNDLTSLPDSAPLSDFLALISRSTEMREAVLERVKTLPNRQRDAASMLQARQGIVMGELRNLGLELTPELCRSGVEFLRWHAVEHRTKRANDNDRFIVAAQDLDKYLFGMRWLAELRCHVTAAVNAYKETARLYPGYARALGVP